MPKSDMGWYLYLAARRWAGEKCSRVVTSGVGCLMGDFDLDRSGYSVIDFLWGFRENLFLR
jgi:hypothetical protein